MGGDKVGELKKSQIIHRTLQAMVKILDLTPSEMGRVVGDERVFESGSISLCLLWSPADIFYTVLWLQGYTNLL